MKILSNFLSASLVYRDSCVINCRRIIVLLGITLVSVQANAQKPAVFSTAEGAVNGYDVVAYFTQQAAVKGSDSLAWVWQDAKWKFSSQANLDSFRTNPARFAPKYGGYCAFGVSGNYKAPTSADAWTIVDNKLYLNYNKSVQASWKKEMEKRIADADRNWPGLVNK